MSVGESLTRARYQAGLTVDELSERTKIRSTVIRSIEADDYAACGGDLYVRGYVRAIAGAVGADAQGLIREYDQERVHALREADATAFDLTPVPAADADGDGQSVNRDPDETRFDLPPVREDSTATRFDIPPVRADHTEDLMAAGYEVQPAAEATVTGRKTPGGGIRAGAAVATPASGSQARRGRRRLLAGVAVVAALALAGVLGVRLASGSTTPTNAAHGATAKASTSASPVTSAAADSKPAASAIPTPSTSVTPTPTPSAHVSPPVRRLSLAAAAAFGPGGLGDGDNPSGAGYTIERHPPLPWSTNWYATAQFGMLKHGTGLLITLAHQSTITSVLVDLTHFQGVNLQLKTADGTEPQDFRVVATDDNTGGAVRLTLRHPSSARYLLIWFTQLPPNGVGQYQESVYHVLVNGRR